MADFGRVLVGLILIGIGLFFAPFFCLSLILVFFGIVFVIRGFSDEGRRARIYYQPPPGYYPPPPPNYYQQPQYTQPEPGKTVACKGCGASLPWGVAFCPHCGRRTQ